MIRGLLATVITLSSCSWGEKSPHVLSAEAHLKGASDTEVVGVVLFTEVEEGVEVVAEIKGLAPGIHGFHIHENGDCSLSDFTSAGGHYNPKKTLHGGPDSDERHTGDLGNIVADENGVAYYNHIDPNLELNGEYSIIGKSIIVHEKRDDYTNQPTGAAGGRVACGVIVPQS